MDKTIDPKSERNKADAPLHPDPITHAPGFHPVGTGLGAVAGGAVGAAAAGAVVGSVIGPVGTAVGALVGGLAGGFLGKEVAETVNPSVDQETERRHWERHHATRPDVAPGTTFDQYAPAYKHGWESRARHPGKSFDDVEPTLGENWKSQRGSSPLEWEHARLAARDAWERVDAKLSTPEPAIQKSGTYPEITHDNVEVRAYYIFLSGSGGSQDDDWFRAERELKRS